MRSYRGPQPTFLKSLSVIVTLTAELFAQKTLVAPPEPSVFGSYTLYIGLVAIGILIAVAVKMRRKKPVDPVPDDGMRLTYNGRNHGRKKIVSAAEEPGHRMPPARTELPERSGFAALPISTFVRLPRTGPYLQLPGSLDPELTDAIDIIGEDSGCDATDRRRALEALRKFRTPSSIKAIAQMALYDLSSKLRSDAVLALADIGHESVFETIVTACADPSHKVRAAAARAFVNFSFDRTQSWTRIIESKDMARMKHAARCAIEGEIVDRSFDRLIHTDRSIAFEAFALTALLIRSGETEPIYDALASERDENVKLALLHVLQTIQENSTPDQLTELMDRVNFQPEVAAKVNEVRSCLQPTYA